jgi:hypothetical protein
MTGGAMERERVAPAAEVIKRRQEIAKRLAFQLLGLQHIFTLHCRSSLVYVHTTVQIFCIFCAYRRS